MTVEDLIELLQALPPTAIVFVCTGLVIDASYDHGSVQLAGEHDNEPAQEAPWH